MKRQTMDHPGLDLFARLLDIPVPSGHEGKMAQFLEEWLRSEGFAPEMDPAGNVLVRFSGLDPDAPLCCYAAHVDEIGLVVRKVEPDGSLLVTRSGGLFAWKLGESPVEVLGRESSVTGVVSFGSGHSKTDAARGGTWEAARVLTGLSPDALAVRGIGVGAPVVPAREMRGPFLLGESDAPWVAAWSFDNRLAVAVMLQVLVRLRDEGAQPYSPTIVAFTVQEEIGCHGAKILAQRESPEIFVAVDGSPLVPESPIALDGRPGIRTKDRVAAYDAALLDEISRISDRAGVVLQPVVYDGAASDASLVYSIGASPRAACFGYVRESSHGFEVTPLRTFDDLLTSVHAVICDLGR